MKPVRFEKSNSSYKQSPQSLHHRRPY